MKRSSGCSIIFDNLIYQLQRSGGVSNYWFELTSRFQFEPGVCFLEASAGENIFRKRMDLAADKIIKDYPFLPASIARFMPIASRIQGKPILHTSYYRTTSHPDAIRVVTVYDFIAEKFHSGIIAELHRRQKKKAIENADAIICISENTRSDLLGYYPHLENKPIRVIYHGVSEVFNNEYVDEQGGHQTHFEEPYLLYVGERGRHKNFAMMVEVAKQAKSFRLVMAGGHALTAAERNLLDRAIPGKYSAFQHLSDREMAYFYRNAYAMIYPSFYEGFGMPIIEAMSAGCPVITTNSSSMAELAGGAALLVENPEMVDEYLFHLEVLRNHSSRIKLIHKGHARAKEFSWDLCFQQTRGFYEEIRSLVG